MTPEREKILRSLSATWHQRDRDNIVGTADALSAALAIDELFAERDLLLSALTEAHNETARTSNTLRAENAKLRAAVSAVGEVLAQNGCDCDCGHVYGDHDDDCDLCLGCRVYEPLAALGAVR